MCGIHYCTSVRTSSYNNTALSYELFRWAYNILHSLSWFYNISYSILSPSRLIWLRERRRVGTIVVKHSEQNRHVRVCYL